MCGRFLLLSSGDEIARLLGLSAPPTLKPRFNIAPTQQIAAVRAGESGRECVNLRWGFAPSWSKDGKIAPINAKSEEAAGKPMFRSAFRKRRCLIPASGFYEWHATPGAKKKQPYAIRLADEGPLAFAGLYETWHGPDGDVESCCILTTAANDLVSNIHMRMPVILDPQSYDQWLDPMEQDAAAVAALLQPFPADRMRAYSVSTWVNDVKHQDARCLEPAA